MYFPSSPLPFPTFSVCLHVYLSLGIFLSSFLTLFPLSLSVLQACKLLVKVGANPHTVEAIEQKSALHFAAQASDNVIVELLLKSGSTLDLPDVNGKLGQTETSWLVMYCLCVMPFYRCDSSPHRSKPQQYFSTKYHMQHCGRRRA